MTIATTNRSVTPKLRSGRDYVPSVSGYAGGTSSGISGGWGGVSAYASLLTENTFNYRQTFVGGLTASGTSYFNGLLTASAGLTVTGQATFNNNVSIVGNLSITGTIDRYNQTELNIGDTFINLGTAQEVNANGGIRMYGAGSVLLSRFEYIVGVHRWDLYGGLNLDAWLTVGQDLNLVRNVNVLNKAGNAWITWATRNNDNAETMIDLKNINSIYTNSSTINTLLYSNGYSYGSNYIINKANTNWVGWATLDGNTPENSIQLNNISSITAQKHIYTPDNVLSNRLGLGGVTAPNYMIEGHVPAINVNTELAIFAVTDQSSADFAISLKTGGQIGTLYSTTILNTNSNTLALNTGGVNRLLIQNDGKVTVKDKLVIGDLPSQGLGKLSFGSYYINKADADLTKADRTSHIKLYEDATDSYGFGVSPHSLNISASGTGNIKFYTGDSQRVVIDSDGRLRSPVYANGFTGTGWNIDKDGNAYVKSLEVRETFRAFTMEVEKLKVSSGSQLFTNGVIISSVEYFYNPGGWYCWKVYYSIENGANYDVFSPNDIVMCQHWNGNTEIKSYKGKVIEVGAGTGVHANERYFMIPYIVPDWYSVFIDEINVPAVGDSICRVSGNVLEITSRDNGYIQIANGITSPSHSFNPTFRLGDVDGVELSGGVRAGQGMGILSKYFVIDEAGAQISNFQIDAARLSTTQNEITCWMGTDAYDATYKGFGVHKDVNNRIRMIEAGGNMYLQGILGGAEVFRLSNATEGSHISNWKITQPRLQKNLNGNIITIGESTYDEYLHGIFLNSDDNYYKIGMFVDPTGSVVIEATEDDIPIFKLGSGGNSIANWTFSDKRFTKIANRATYWLGSEPGNDSLSSIGVKAETVGAYNKIIMQVVNPSATNNYAQLAMYQSDALKFDLRTDSNASKFDNMYLTSSDLYSNYFKLSTSSASSLTLSFKLTKPDADASTLTGIEIYDKDSYTQYNWISANEWRMGGSYASQYLITALNGLSITGYSNNIGITTDVLLLSKRAASNMRINISTLPTAATGLSSGDIFTQTATQLGGSGAIKVLCIV